MTLAHALRTAAIAAATVAFAAIAVSGASAEPDGSRALMSASGAVTQNLQMTVGQSKIIDLPEDASEIYVSDPKIANAIVRSARRIYVSAVGNGQTTIFALGAGGRKIKALDVLIGRDAPARKVPALTSLLNAAIPGNDIHVTGIVDSIILTGSVASAGDAQKAVDIASAFINEAPSITTQTEGKGILPDTVGAGGGPGDEPGSRSGSQTKTVTGKAQGKVINSLIIRGLDQVSLRVTIAEIRREIVKQLGVSMTGNGPNGSLKLDNPFAINGAVATSEVTLNWFRGAGELSATVQAFERQGVAHTLAEPTVTAVSGESAKFMAGGTIPIANSETCNNGGAFGCTIGFIQQPYGVTLNFTPVVLSQGRIQLRIAAEVTDVDYASQVTTNGISIPGFRTRNNVTTVELPSGGSIATAGLIGTQTQQAVNGFPALMNVPILGALFRSHDYQRNETELLIVVTPYIVHAVDLQQIVRPDQNFEEASDPQAWFLGRVNRIYSSSGSLQPMPGYAGQIGFITQ